MSSVKRILFVCTGNTCRSPMAEALLNANGSRRGLQIEVRSAGVSTIDGLPVSAHSRTALERRGIKHTGCSKALDGGMVNWADLVLTMTSGHKKSLLHQFPEAVNKTFTLKEYVNCDEEVLATIAELEGIYTEWQMKQALGQQLSEVERRRLLELERLVPEFDIADPFGGSQETYEQCAAEIGQALDKLLDMLERGEDRNRLDALGE
ncbi:low molecular weight protein arginine phosphatase [Paenibacillus sp. GCM10027626]|uniref:low molecular weight protein arginine phosphatase n=1 Tax=Paenibacillus sp. GCM10027626 TaxID=3273411 RepID=UPI0036439F2F